MSTNNLNFIPNHIHTSIGSLLDGCCKIEKLSKKCKELGYTSCMITDHGNISGCIKFHSEMTKNGIKPIIGNEFYCSYQDSNIKTGENRDLFHTVVIAKNKESYFKLVKATSLSHHPDNFYYKPRLDLEKLSSIIGDSCFVFSGHPGSYLWNCKTVEACVNGIKYLKSLFGKDNIIVEIQRFLQDKDVDEHIKILEEACKLTNTRKIACADIHYLNKEDAETHRVLLCSNLRLTLPQINRMPDKPMSAFFNSEKFYLPALEELINWGHTEDELDFTFIDSQCEQYELKEYPRLPKFSQNETELIRNLCIDGWKRKSRNWGEEYKKQINYELEIFDKFNLNGYFLIVSDYIKWAKKRMLCGPGRGCFLPDTRVKMSNNLMKPISTIGIGEYVIDANGNKQVVENVLKYSINEEIIELEMENNKIIRCTKDHKFLTNNRGWVEAQYLNELDDIKEV